MAWFVSEKTHDREIHHLQQQVYDLQHKCYTLAAAHARLLEHLGLYEQELKGVVIRSKGGPEPGDD